MSAPKFSIGDRVWLATYATEKVPVTCPVCFGHRSVTLVLGNADECRLPCHYCGNGYQGPRGVVDEYKAVEGAREGVVESVTSSLGGVEYGGETWHADASNVFATEAEAVARAAELAIAETRRLELAAEFGKHDAKRTSTWNAGYHIREARRKRAEADRHDAMAAVCKSKSKEAK